MREPGGFLHRVGAVRDDDAVNFGIRVSFRDGAAKVLPDGARHRHGVDAGDFMDVNAGDIGEAGNGREKRINAEVLEAVARHLARALARGNNRAAAGEEADLG